MLNFIYHTSWRQPSVFLAVLCVVAHGAELWAQVPQSRALANVQQINLVIEDLGDEAGACNVSKDGLDASARLPLSNSKMSVSSSASPYLYVGVTVMRLASGLCVAGINVQFYRISTEFLAFVSVWDKSEILSGRAAQFGLRVSTAVEEKTKMFIAAWLKANEQR